jgi:DNA-binding transcriptional MerR regulator
MTSEARYAIGDLARLADVSRRTVRYYVQESLIPAPLGVGRGNHYGAEHLERILRVKALQEAGQTLDEIRRALSPRGAERARTSRPVLVERSLWRRVTLAPGVELQVAGHIRLPPAGRLQELAGWCRLHLISNIDPEGEADDV